jgi:sporulation protein YlmC with PRC-barrel domain
MSKLKLLSSVAVAALIAMPAFAQTSTTPTTSPSTSRPATTAPAGTSGASSHSMPSDIHQWKVSDLVGKNVYNSSNEKVGDINEVVVSKTGGGKAMAVIGVGGFLGIGEKEAAVPLDELKVQDDKIVGAGLSKDSLKQHADYKGQKDNYTKLDRNQTVGQASGATGTSSTTGTTTRPSTSGTSTTGTSTGSSSTGTSGSTMTPSGTTGAAGGATTPSGSSATTPSGTGSSSGTAGTSGSMNSGSSSTGSGSMGSGSSSGTSGSSSMGSGSSTSPNPAATTNPPDNSTATKKQ